MNANTSRIKDVETTVDVNGKYTDTDSGTQASRTTFQADGDLLSKTENKGKQYGSSVTANAELKKETGKIWFHVRPNFTHGRTEGFTNGNSQVTREGTWMNSATSSTHSLSRTNEGELSAFPKNNQGRDVMIDSPSEIDQAQLDELQIDLRPAAE